jgi:hypothetical protein
MVNASMKAVMYDNVHTCTCMHVEGRKGEVGGEEDVRVGVGGMNGGVAAPAHTTRVNIASTQVCKHTMHVASLSPLAPFVYTHACRHTPCIPFHNLNLH